MKLATSAPAPRTVKVLPFEFDPAEFDAVKVTVNDPPDVKVCVGFCVLEVPPSPNAQDHDVGLPVEVSVNWIACPAVGDAGTKVKLATGALDATTDKA